MTDSKTFAEVTEGIRMAVDEALKEELDGCSFVFIVRSSDDLQNVTSNVPPDEIIAFLHHQISLIQNVVLKERFH